MRDGYEKRFKYGDIVYWCRNKGNGKYRVEFGMVDEQFSDAVCVDYIVPRERRRINGVPISDFENYQPFRKLPKGWTYDTVLHEITYDDLTPEEKGFEIDITKPETLQKAYEKGFLVKDSTIFHGDIEDEITKEGYRTVLKYSTYKIHETGASIRPDKVYFTFEEAKKEVDANIAEFQRQADLSEYDWSVEQIDKTIGQWKHLTGSSDEEAKQYRDWILGMRNVEDIETRIMMGGIQWKYWNHKKWHNIAL